MTNPILLPLPDGLACPVCSQMIVAQTPVMNKERAGFKKGNIMVCSKCAHVLIVGDSALEQMSNEAIARLDAASKVVLKSTIQAIQRANASQN